MAFRLNKPRPDEPHEIGSNLSTHIASHRAFFNYHHSRRDGTTPHIYEIPALDIGPACVRQSFRLHQSFPRSREGTEANRPAPVFGSCRETRRHGAVRKIRASAICPIPSTSRIAAFGTAWAIYILQTRIVITGAQLLFASSVPVERQIPYSSSMLADKRARANEEPSGGNQQT